MSFADLEPLITEKFNLERDKLQQGFLKQTGLTASQFTARGTLASGMFINAAIEEHCTQINKRSETLMRCVLTVLDAAREPVSEGNLNEIFDYMNRVIDLQYRELSGGIGPITTVAQALPTQVNLLPIELEKFTSAEKRKIKNDLDIMILANRASSAANAGAATYVSNIINYGKIVGFQTGPNSTFNQTISANNLKEFTALIDSIKAQVNSPAVVLNKEVKQEIIEAADTLDTEIKSEKKNKFTVVGAMSVLGNWAGKIEAINEAVDKVRALLAAHGYL